MRFRVGLDTLSVVANQQSGGIAMAICAISAITLLSMPSQAATTAGDSGKLSAGVLNQIGALEQEKASRTAAEQKIDSHLLFAQKMKLGLPIAQGVRTQRVLLDRDNTGHVLMDIDADVTEGLLAFLKAH